MIIKKIVFACLFALIIGVATSCLNKQALGYINDPIVGDLYEVKLGKGKYTIYSISQLSSDSITFKVQLKTVESQEELQLLMQEDIDNIYADKRGLYQSGSISFSKEQLAHDLDNGKILNINRMTHFRRVN